MLIKDLVMPFATGLAIFLFGMQAIKIGFENLFLSSIKKWLQLLTHSTWIALITGAFTTALLQSSSAVSLLAIAFTHAKVLNLRQAIGIILGANIGTCLTTELIAFQINDLGVYFFIGGIILFLFPKIPIKSTGLACAGFGLLFIGMNTIQSISSFLEEAGWIQYLLLEYQHTVWQGVVSGSILTAMIQSSTATTAITMNLVASQLLPLSVGIGIVLGSNIGTCITAIIASIGTNLSAKRVAVAHVALNVIGVLLFLPIIPLFILFIEWLTPNPFAQIAHAQTIFNIICSLIILPWISLFEKLVLRLTPEE